MSFAERLKSILSERKIKLSQLCRDTGISYNTMQSIIKRNTDVMSISVQIPVEIAKYLEIDFYELVGEEAAEKIQKEKPATGEGDGLTDEEWEHIKLYRAASPELQAAALAMLEAAEKARLARDLPAKDK